jgi:branched-chain amino acid transport system substrate-binding protein
MTHRGTHPGESRLGRRSVLAAGLAAGSGLALPLLSPFPARAADYPAVGTYPAGVSGDTCFIGLTPPLTGAYSADGKDLSLGYQLAIAQINEGGDIPAKWGLKGKGVLGKTIRYKIADGELKPNVAVQEQTQFIEQDKAIMISGCTDSATAIALEELAQRMKVINMVGASGSNDTTGKDCQRYGFRSQPSAYMASTALGPVVAKAFGRNRKVAYLVPDYTYGFSVFDSFAAATKKFGWTIASKQVVPVGAADYSSALINIANSDAEIFCNVCFGNDSVASSKQADQFGVLKKMKMVVPNISSFQAQETGAAIMGGVYGTFDFWWTLEDTYPLAKDFVESFYAVNKYRPNWCAHIAYMQTYIWALAVERAGTFYPVEVIKTLEASQSQPFDSTLGKVWYRAEDHQLVRPVPVVLGKTPDQMKSKDDFFTVVALVPGEQAINPVTDLMGCKLGSYT